MSEIATLSPKKKTAAMALASGKTREAAAAEAGVNPRTVYRWLDEEVFQAAIAAYRAELDERTMQRWATQRHRRVDVLMRQAERMLELIDARAEEMASEIAGGGTGLLVRQTRSVGFGENNMVVTEYAFDGALNRELRETLKQMAQELGQWSEKTDITTGDQPLTFTINIDRLQGDDDD